MTTFPKKLTLKYQRPLVLKSLPHTCRIRLLLQMFPGAKFVHIHRNPYAVFQSAIGTTMSSSRRHRLQKRESESFGDRVIEQYKRMYKVLFEECSLIPEGHFHEICFEDLEQDPIGQTREADG